MKLSVVLCLGMMASALCAAKQVEVRSPADDPGASRRGRFLFLSGMLAGPAALASAGANSVGNSFISLSKTLGSLGQQTTTRPNIIYVPRPCLLPLFTGGCPSGYVCSAVRTGGTRCVPQSSDGLSCTTGFQCTSGVCRNSICVKDECPNVGGRSTCTGSLVCVATKQGNRCQVAPNSDECPRLLTTMGCEKNQYCTSGADGNICSDKLAVGGVCSDSVECLSGTCRNRKCKADACPVIDMSIDCMPMQYCAPGETGNMCMAKKANGASCSAPRQCMSSVCDNGNCVQDECPHPYMPGRCLPTQFCSPAPNGNMCLEKRSAGSMCDRDIECMSSTCRNKRCVVDQCLTPFSTNGCDVTMQYCMSTTSGNQCVTKLANDHSCLMAIQCMSNNCASGICAAQVPVQKANGVACASASECSSGNCVLGTCAASKMSIGGMCLAALDCESLTCTNMACVEATTTTTPATTTTTDASATTTTTAAATTTATTTTTTTTAAPLADGGLCSVAADCESVRCVSGVCVAALLGQGTACAVHSECLSNNCNSLVCSLGTVGTGNPCTNDFQCNMGQCLATKLCA